MVVGELSGIVMQALHTGFTPEGITRSYRGFEAEMQFPKEFWVLLENAHFHAFIVPVVLLVLTHVFFMTGVAERTKVAVTIWAYTAAAVELSSPWLVRYGAAGFAWLALAGSLAFHASMLLLIALPLYDAWLGPLEEPLEPPG